MSAVIDLTVPRLLRFSVLPSGEIEVVDDITFDPDPESRWHVRGCGRTDTEAVADLLDQLEDDHVPDR